MQKSDYTHVFEGFGLDQQAVSDESLYPFSPVFKAKFDGQDVIIKRTKTPPVSRAHQLLQWTHALRAAGVKVVTPVEHADPYLVEAGELVWIMYPFVSGDPYTGTKNDIVQAAKLLADIHTTCADGDYDLPRFSWDNYDEDFAEEVRGDVQRLAEVLQEAQIPAGTKIWETLSTNVETCLQQTLPRLKSLELPHIKGCWDYKANNLIYGQDGKPTLVDPDNAGHIPRLFDVGLALILFHNELLTAPARLFSSEEWEWFKEGYFETIAFTAIEKEIWQDYLWFVFVDEALWLILEDWEYCFKREGARNAHQKAFVLSLLNFNPENYPL